ncbi:MAG: DUF6273 domain-containing protein [Eubacteriales bacterium]|nr:DUF6273 domain-containing protein [Eubacteriales bacterium]
MERTFNNYRGLETTAVCNLMKQMIKRGATDEELLKVVTYFESAIDFDAANIRLNDAAQKNDVKALAEKYNSFDWTDGIVRYCEADVEATKEAINRLFGIPNGVTVFRKQKTRIPISDIKVGDQITIPLKGFGTFLATAHKVTDNGAMFIFDEYVAKRPMNEKNTNHGGFEESDLKRWMDTELFGSFPDWIKSRIYGLTIPTVGEIIGWGDNWDKEHFEKDFDQQLPLMKECKNRSAYFKNKLEWGWLRNAVKQEYSSAGFAVVSNFGVAYYGGASFSGGVRPEFWLVR